MKFAQLMNDVSIAPSGSHRVSFSSDNIQGLLIKVDEQGVAPFPIENLFINANVGSTFNIARCSLRHLQQIGCFERGSNYPVVGSAAAMFLYIDLGSIWMSSNEEIEIYIDNEDANLTPVIDLSVVYNSDAPQSIITYQNIIDSNFSRENVQDIWAFANSYTDNLSETEDVATIQNDTGSQSTKIKVFGAYTQTQANDEIAQTDYAQIYTDPDELLMKVTLSMTGMYDSVSNPNGVKNFIAVCDDTPEEKQESANKKYIFKKKAKLAAMPMLMKRLNKLKGRL